MQQENLFDPDAEKQLSGPVTCLGKEFENDEERRKHFTALLRDKLKDPEFRKIEGFPVGEDEDILALSDPPYYTACPNPWIAEFVKEWESQKPPKPEGEYHREPFAADVSEGKNDPIYTFHTYHTKVPHKAVMRYILHYTSPGDILLDGFCGTGMAGVAAMLCGSKDAVEALGFSVSEDGTIFRDEFEESGKKVLVPFSKLGERKCILGDIAPSATLIAKNYNYFKSKQSIIDHYELIKPIVSKECEWMYKTSHEGGGEANIVFVLWSDVFICPFCSHDLVFWEIFVDENKGKVKNHAECPNCSAKITKKEIETKWQNLFDKLTERPVRVAVQVPVVIKYKYGKKTFTKKPDENDLDLLKKISEKDLRFWVPTNSLPEGSNTRQPLMSHGIERVHQFYTKRNLQALSVVNANIGFRSPLSPILTSMILRSSVMNRLVVNYFFNGGGGANGAHLKGTLYVSSLPTETPITEQLENKVNSLLAIAENQNQNKNKHAVLTTQSMSSMRLPDNSLDYLFLDPPFGGNINYSELNSIWESWMKVFTNNEKEAIQNATQKKGAREYKELMFSCFKEAYRTLKPGRWLTLEFSNTKASVWNSIQAALAESGFIVAGVSALDKKQGSFKAVTTPTAVKQDLVISAYKPEESLDRVLNSEIENHEGVWTFVSKHLGFLPVTKMQGKFLQFLPERDARILFDQVVAYFVRKGLEVPISSYEFQAGLNERFPKRDGMFFLPEQVPDYDKKKLKSAFGEHASLFVSDEFSAINWLGQVLAKKPQAFSDLNPQFMQQIGGWSKNEEQLDLRDLLSQNFLSYDGSGPVPEQIHAYLSSNWKEMRNLEKEDPTLVAKAKDRWYVPDPNKVGDLEKLREKALLKEFEEYKLVTKKLKVFRLEAVRAGFKKAWQERDYQAIIKVAEKIATNVLEEDPKLLMWYDQALTRLGDE